MGSYRSQPDRIKMTYSSSTSDIQFALCHMCGWRLYMEDTAIEGVNFDGKNNHIFGIFDGHGGAQVAIFTQKHFVDELLKNKNYMEKNYHQAFQQTFEKIDKLLKSDKGEREIKNIQKQLILQDNLPNRDCKQSAGCCALVCFLSDDKLIISNAGDSQAFAKKNGQFCSLNRIHVPTLPQEKTRIQRAGGCVNQQGRINCCINISRSIGDWDFKSNRKLPQCKQMIISIPEITEQNIEGIQYILLGCDGIWQQKSPVEIQEFIDKRMKQKLQLSKILEEMFEWLICKEEQCDLKQQGKDNMSAILIKLNHNPHHRGDRFDLIKTEEIIQF